MTRIGASMARAGTLAAMLALIVASPATAQDGGALDAGLDAGVPRVDAAWDGAVEERDGAIPEAAEAGVVAPLAPPDAGPPDAGPPDAGSDAGPPDAGPPPVVVEEDDGADRAWSLVEQFLFERRERERQATPPAPVETDDAETSVVDIPRGLDVRLIGCSARELLGVGMPERRVSTFGLVLLLGLAFLLVLGIDRLRRPLPERGVLPRVLSVAHLTLRLSAVVMLIMLTARLLPTWLHPALLITIAAVAIAIGFGTVWTMLPDVVGGIILVTERRLRPGLFISGDGFSGAIDRVGPRLTVLRAHDGTTWAVPNRELVRTHIRVSSRRWYEIEVELAAPPDVDAARVRRAIEEAVLCSPHIPPDPRLSVARDPARPDRWRVRARLLEARFAADFQGELLERTEEALAREAESEPEPDPEPEA